LDGNCGEEGMMGVFGAELVHLIWGAERWGAFPLPFPLPPLLVDPLLTDDACGRAEDEGSGQAEDEGSENE
jgi:hypothetical protein